MPDLNGRRIVVTGGAGFIGSHLVDALVAAGARRVAVVDNLFLGKPENLAAAQQAGDVHLYREDAAEPSAIAAVIEAEKPDLVFNLATKALLYSFFNPAGACQVNLSIALNLAELLRADRYGRLIHVSSSEVYGSAVQVPMGEDHPLLAETTYAAGKAAADLAIASYVRMFGLDVVVARPFNNYGPRQNAGEFAAVIPITVNRIFRGEAPIIEGTGDQTRDFIFVSDTVSALCRLALAEGATGHVLNIASGKETPIRELITTLASVLGWDGPMIPAPERRADVHRHVADVRRAEALIGPLATTSLADGLKTTVDWYRTLVG